MNTMYPLMSRNVLKQQYNYFNDHFRQNMRTLFPPPKVFSYLIKSNLGPEMNKQFPPKEKKQHKSSNYI